ncbi:MAG: 2OG-Fe dioxygenase family protein [Rhodospirillales bacterium]|nr:2OG-Fe dioxygenase family protein [Rhodospirillales bacterium]
MPPLPDFSALDDRLQRDGFAFLTARVMGDLLDAPAALADWPAFAASWNDLAPDTYLAAQGRHRRRRHATFAVGDDGPLVRAPHQPHFQSLSYNPLQGDIQRWFEPIEPAVADGATLRRILAFCCTLFGTLAARTGGWHVEVHQFRIEAKPGEAGEPTPEGVHRDGVDYVLVLMVERHNIQSGTTSIHGLDRARLGSFTLTDPLDAALVDDRRVYHGVTAIEPLDAAQPAWRDVLVATFRKS